MAFQYLRSAPKPVSYRGAPVATVTVAPYLRSAPPFFMRSIAYSIDTSPKLIFSNKIIWVSSEASVPAAAAGARRPSNVVA